MSIFYYIISFFVIINIIVFVHEFGHYYAARSIGVKVTTFSIGMGPELFGFTDKNGTRWCFSMIPVGGYVMVLGDADASSTTEDEELMANLSEDQKKESIFSKNNWEKMLFAFAGPFANYIYAFVVTLFMALSFGVPKYDPVVGGVLENSAAERAGFLAGDKIISVNGESVIRYRDILINIANSESEILNFSVERNGTVLSIDVIPDIKEKKKAFGGTKKTKLIGIKSMEPVFERMSLIDAIVRAFNDCVYATKELSKMLVHLFSGKKSLDDFGGVVRMASMAGDLSQSGNFALLIMFTVTLSLNLGFINLFPMPVLDGGRILICFIEQIRNRKINQKLLENVMMVCALLLMFLMLVTTVNDILRIEMVSNFIDRLF